MRKGGFLTKRGTAPISWTLFIGTKVVWVCNCANYLSDFRHGNKNMCGVQFVGFLSGSYQPEVRPGSLCEQKNSQSSQQWEEKGLGCSKGKSKSQDVN